MYIAIDDNEVQLVVHALQAYAAEHRRAAERCNEESYPESTRNKILKTSVAAYDLGRYFEKQIDDHRERLARRTDTQTVDPYDIQWPSNDPRKW
jgi:hypothetical protein